LASVALAYLDFEHLEFAFLDKAILEFEYLELLDMAILEIACLVFVRPEYLFQLVIFASIDLLVEYFAEESIDIEHFE